MSTGFFSARKRARLLTETDKRLVKEAFNLFDTNNDGFLDYYEFKASARSLGFQMRKTELLNILETYDRDNTNLINYEDFYEIMEEKMQKRDPVEEAREAFKLIANDKTNSISFRDLKYAAVRVGADIPDRDLRSMIEEFDTKGEGKIDEEDFINMIGGEGAVDCAGFTGLDMDEYDRKEGNRNAVLEGTKALLKTAESLERSRRIAEESEEIGTSIIADLGTQRESLERARDSLHNTDQYLTQSRKILNSMYRRVFTNKFILIVIIVLEVFILGGEIYLKFFKRH